MEKNKYYLIHSDKRFCYIIAPDDEYAWMMFVTYYKSDEILTFIEFTFFDLCKSFLDKEFAHTSGKQSILRLSFRQEVKEIAANTLQRYIRLHKIALNG